MVPQMVLREVVHIMGNILVTANQHLCSLFRLLMVKRPQPHHKNVMAPQMRIGPCQRLRNDARKTSRSIYLESWVGEISSNRASDLLPRWFSFVLRSSMRGTSSPCSSIATNRTVGCVYHGILVGYALLKFSKVNVDIIECGTK